MSRCFSEIPIRVGDRFADSACMVIKESKQISAVTKAISSNITSGIRHEGLSVKLLASECTIARLWVYRIPETHKENFKYLKRRTSKILQQKNIAG